MRCPLCEVTLIGTERLGVRAGYCPEWEGEWFARGAVNVVLGCAGRTGDGHEPGIDATGEGVAPAVRDDVVTAAATDRREGVWNWF